jgi:hypothetical protein
MAWRDYLEVPAVERGDFAKIEPFGKSDDACVNHLEPQRGIGGEQLGHPPVVMRRRLDDPQLVVSYGGAEFRSQPGKPAPPRISEQMADLGDRQRRDHQARPVRGEERHAPGVIAVRLVESRDQRSSVAQDHADAAPLSASRSG